jgi:hypothetical protein
MDWTSILADIDAELSRLQQVRKLLAGTLVAVSNGNGLTGVAL